VDANCGIVANDQHVVLVFLHGCLLPKAAIEGFRTSRKKIRA
jgi:hypothetical protein